MENLNNLNPIDFCYNGRWLSEFGGIVINENLMNLIPERKVMTDNNINSDGECISKGIKISPRHFSIFVKFENIKRVREIAGWLNIKEPREFYFKGDSIKLKALIDNVVNAEVHGDEGLVNLSFTAYDPYYYAIEDTIFTCIKPSVYEPPTNLYNAIEVVNNKFNLIKITDVKNIPSNVIYYPNSYLTKNKNNIIINMETLQQTEIYNIGNVESYPLYKIKGKDTIVININGKETFRIKLDSTGNDYIYIDTCSYSCYKGDIDRFYDVEGINSVKSVPNGKVLYEIIGECTEFEIDYRSCWI